MKLDHSLQGFHRVLRSTLSVLRRSCRADLCIFLQLDDPGTLSVRAASGPSTAQLSRWTVKPEGSCLEACLRRNRILECTLDGKLPVPPTLGKRASRGGRVILIPVTGENRALGLLWLGPVRGPLSIKPREAEFRMTGTLCAVVSANWRLYEWMTRFLSEMNHDLRTPLTAVQGSLGMVLGGLFGNVGGDMKQMLELAQKGCQRTVKAIENHLNGRVKG